MNVLAIIPARGGSKGIPRKNLVCFKGAPLVVHSIRHALESEQVNRVLVSTDDAEIRDVSLRHGAEVPFLRPAKFAEDHVLDLPVFEHALRFLEEVEGYRPEIVVHLRPTTPHRKPAWIDEAVRLLVSLPEADSVRSVSLPEKHPYRMFRIGPDGYLDPQRPGDRVWFSITNTSHEPVFVAAFAGFAASADLPPLANGAGSDDTIRTGLPPQISSRL